MRNKANNQGFTIIELLVSLAIFAMMTALVLSKYGNFNQGVILTNLAYDVALTIRNAQSYGLNVKSAKRNEDLFKSPYGVHFETGTNTKFIFFVDLEITPDGIYNDSTEDLSVTNIKRGSTINALCAGSDSSCTAVDKLDITFKRPDPNAIIKGIKSDNSIVSGNYAKITVKSSDNVTRNIVIRSTGQISVE